MTSNESFGFARVAAASPAMQVADCEYNAQHIIEMMTRAEHEDVAVLVFPELCITGYTCADLFHQPRLQHAAIAALGEIVEKGGAAFSGVAVVGLPFPVGSQLFNCAAVVYRGTILGIVAKSFLPTYKEFYERRWFAPAMAAPAQEVTLLGKTIPFGNDLL
ncbi:MAG: nitrilase-related carbon-nitrogen hydrolase, partial [Terriglobia bacterium]